MAVISISTAQARLIETVQPVQQRWKTITELDVASGSTVPAATNVFFHVPPEIDTIGREVLLGQRGQTTRYWGYCFPSDVDPDNPPQSTGFPGKFFLSEAERAWRKQQELRQRPFSPFQTPVETPSQSLIRHQLDIFRGGMTCYVMTERELPMGLDQDDDWLNSKLEQQYLTDPAKADTDGDGVNDGVEILARTSATRRDTDGDALIDGIEDKNHNGKLDAGETDPRVADTDGDTLCDGMCHSAEVRKVCKDNLGRICMDLPYGALLGEDKNLNGKVDTGESDPRKADSLGDGVRDDQRYYRCVLDGRKDC
jgi:hypothetical protein